MPLSYVLKQVGAKTGLDPAQAGQRDVLLRYANEAADELWTECDIVGSYTEQVFRVNGGQTITLPSDVGSIRACREFYSQNPIHINQMRPRYNMYNWKDGWYNYRLKNTQALMRTITNQSIITYSVAVADSDLTVIVTGPTAVASSISEVVKLNTLTQQGSVNFIDIVSVTKNKVTESDVTLTDVDGNVLTVIPNNALEAKYQILDISTAPWLSVNTGTIDNYVEILYKKVLPYYSNDAQEFPVQGFDNQWVNKCLQLYYEDQGNAQAALSFDAKATRGLARKERDQNRATEDMVSFTQQDYDTIQPRIRGARFTRWTGWRRR